MISIPCDVSKEDVFCNENKIYVQQGSGNGIWPPEEDISGRVRRCTVFDDILFIDGAVKTEVTSRISSRWGIKNRPYICCNKQYSGVNPVHIKFSSKVNARAKQIFYA
jgi:hypothetical protein